jgi:hypothetical protein
MKRLLTLGIVLIPLVVVIALVVSSGGGDEENTSRPAPSNGVEAPSEGTTPPSAPGQLPPEFVECMADQGFDIESSADIHSAPPQVLQQCFGSLHQGGGGP